VISGPAWEVVIPGEVSRIPGRILATWRIAAHSMPNARKIVIIVIANIIIPDIIISHIIIIGLWHYVVITQVIVALWARVVIREWRHVIISHIVIPWSPAREIAWPWKISRSTGWISALGRVPLYTIPYTGEVVV